MLTVVIPATNAPPTLDRCLAALERSGEPHEVEVVRSRATADPPRPASRRRPDGRRDRRLRRRRLEVHPDALRRLREVLERDPGLAAVFGGYDDRPAVTTAVSRFRNLLHHHVHASSPGPATTFWAGLGAVRREAFDAVGGFDAQRYPHPSIEDIELGMRLHAAGHRIAARAGRARHTPQALDAGVDAATDLGARGAPWVALRLERGGAGGGALNLSWRQRLAALAAVAAAGAALTGRGRLAAAALAAMIVPNARFYALLARLGGPRLALSGVPLHLIHHLTAAAAVPAGIVVWARGARRR